MLHYLSTEEIGGYELFFPDGDDLTLPYISRAIKDVGTPLGKAHLDLKKLYRMTALKYRLKWKRVSPSGNTTGTNDTTIAAADFECINMNFRSTLSRDAGAAVSIDDIELDFDQDAIDRAGLILNAIMFQHVFLLTNTAVLKPSWPFAFTFTNADWDEVDVRKNGVGGSIYAVRGSPFAGLSPTSQSGPHQGNFRVSPDSPVGGDFTGSMNTDIAAEASDPNLYSADPSSKRDTDGIGTTLYYQEFWQIVQG